MTIGLSGMEEGWPDHIIIMTDQVINNHMT